MADQTDQPQSWWTNHAGGYCVCSHAGCSPGRDCLRAAQHDYDGPGHFAHAYFEPLLRPGACGTCGEPPEAH